MTEPTVTYIGREKLDDCVVLGGLDVGDGDFVILNAIKLHFMCLERRHDFSVVARRPLK